MQEEREARRESASTPYPPPTMETQTYPYPKPMKETMETQPYPLPTMETQTYPYPPAVKATTYMSMAAKAPKEKSSKKK